MPTALVMGVDYELFWTLNPRTLKPFEEAYRLRIKDQNQLFFIQGQYTMSALSATVGNMFLKRGHSPIEYPNEPFDIFKEKQLKITDNMTDEEITNETNKFFNSLIKMQEEFEKNR